MALKVGELVAFIRADTRGVKTGIRDTRRELDSLRTGFSRLAGPTLGAAMLAVKGAVAAGGLATAVGAAAVAVTGLAAAAAGAIPMVIGLGAALVKAAGAGAAIPGVLAAVAAAVGVVKLGMIGLGDAMKAVATGDAEKLNEALKRLAPNAQAFVKQVNALRPAFEKLRLGVQNRLFANTATVLRNLAAAVLPTTTAGANRLADALNRGVVNALNGLNTAANRSTLATVLGAATVMTGNLAAALRPVGQALIDVVGVGAQVTAQLSSGLGAAVGVFAERLSEMARSGELKTMILDGLAAMKDLFAVGSNLLGILRGLGRAAGMDTGGGLFAILERINEAINAPSAQAALTKVFDELGKIGVALTPVLIDVLKALVPVAKGIAQIAVAAAPAIAAFAGKLGDALGALAPGFVALVPLISTLGDALMPIAKILVGLVTGAAPGLDALLQGLVGALTALAPAAAPLGKALGDVLTAIAPILPMLGVELARVLVALAPVLTDAARLIAPLIPDLGRLLRVVADLAVLLLGEFRLSADEMVVGVTAITIAIKVVTSVLRAVVTVIGWVISLFRMTREVAGHFSDTLTASFKTALLVFRNLPQQILTALGNLGTLLVGAGRSLVDGFTEGIKGAWHRVTDAIGGLVQKVPAGVRNLLGIGSPSRVFAQIGAALPAGMALGITRGMPQVTAAVGRMAALATPAPAFAGTAAGWAGGGQPNVNVSVNVREGALGFLAEFIDVQIGDHDTATASAVAGGTRP